MVVYKRNITVGIGCICQPMEINRVHQIEEVIDLNQLYFNTILKKFMISKEENCSLLMIWQSA